jgi:hypothetical protein
LRANYNTDWRGFNICYILSSDRLAVSANPHDFSIEDSYKMPQSRHKSIESRGEPDVVVSSLPLLSENQCSPLYEEFEMREKMLII